MKVIYDKDGIGITELSVLSLYEPEMYEIVESLIDKQPEMALEIARRSMNSLELGPEDLKLAA